MRVYADTSFLVSWLYPQDVNHPRAATWFAARVPIGPPALTPRAFRPTRTTLDIGRWTSDSLLNADHCPANPRPPAALGCRVRSRNVRRHGGPAARHRAVLENEPGEFPEAL